MGSVVRKYPTYVVIPYKDEPQFTKHVVGLCLQEEDVNHICLLDNGSSGETKLEIEDYLNSVDVGDKEIHVFDCEGMKLYAMWNAGWQFSTDNERRGPASVVFLNNDIDFIPGTITRMVFMLRRMEDCLIIYPDYDRSVEQRIHRGNSVKLTHGTKKDGGMCGHMFAIRGEAAKKGLAMFDEQFEWWCGDDDFVRTVEQYPASQYRLVGYPCDHVNEGTAGNGDNEWTHEAKARDIQRLIDKWGYF